VIKALIHLPRRLARIAGIFDSPSAIPTTRRRFQRGEIDADNSIHERRLDQLSFLVDELEANVTHCI
jgi:hypothetical protein